MEETPSTLWEIAFYQDARGRIPVDEFVQSMQPAEQAAVARAIDLLRVYGPLLRKPHVEHIQDKLWELRAGAGRVFYFLYIERRFVLLHAYRKKSQKAPRREIDRALRCMEDYIERKRRQDG